MTIPTNCDPETDVNEFYTENLWKRLRKLYRTKYDIDIAANFARCNDKPGFITVSFTLNNSFLEHNCPLVVRHEQDRKNMNHDEIHEAKWVKAAYQEKFKSLLPDIGAEFAILARKLPGCPHSQ